MRIRPYETRDLPALYDICLRTGDAGADASGTCSHPKLLGDYYAAPYAEFDPSLCLILEDESGAAGYVIGAVNTQAFVAWFNQCWLPGLRERYRGLRARRGASDGWLIRLLKSDASVPPCAISYPAHLHIDLLPRTQGKGGGRKMFEAWIALAAARGAPAVHLGVAPANTGAIGFYERMGMRRLEAGPGAVMFGLEISGCC